MTLMKGGCRSHCNGCMNVAWAMFWGDELQNTIELRATVSQIAAPKPDLDAKAEKRRF